MTVMSGPHALERGDDFRRRRHVPDVNAQPDDLRVPGQQRFRDVHRALVDVELQERCGASQRPQVGQQIAQPERGVDVLRVERGENDVRHRGGRMTYFIRGERNIEGLLHGGLEVLPVQLVALRVVSEVVSAARVVLVAQLHDHLGSAVLVERGGAGDVDGARVEIGGLHRAGGIHAFDFEHVIPVRALPFAGQLGELRSGGGCAGRVGPLGIGGR